MSNNTTVYSSKSSKQTIEADEAMKIYKPTFPGILIYGLCGIHHLFYAFGAQEFERPLVEMKSQKEMVEIDVGFIPNKIRFVACIYNIGKKLFFELVLRLRKSNKTYFKLFLKAKRSNNGIKVRGTLVARVG